MTRRPPLIAAKLGRIVNGGAAKQVNSPKVIDNTPRTHFTRVSSPRERRQSSEMAASFTASESTCPSRHNASSEL